MSSPFPPYTDLASANLRPEILPLIVRLFKFSFRTQLGRTGSTSKKRRYGNFLAWDAEEDRSFALFALHPNPSAMAFDDLPRDGEANASSFVLSFRMELLEHIEDALF